MSYRYLGNKTKLAEWIVDSIATVVSPGAAVADPMCGTAAVALALAKRGYSVHASDSLTFPVIHATVRLLAKEEPEFDAFGGYGRALSILNSLPSVEGYFYREFGASGNPANGRRPQKYFSAENAGRIDAIRRFVASAHERGNISDLEHAVLLQNLLLAVNEVANIAGTYGYFRSEIGSNAKKKLKLVPLDFVNTIGNHVVTKGDIAQVAPNLHVDAVYLDPPYTKRQYAGNYHILETIAREDNPEAMGDGGLRPWQEDASPFCYKRTAGKFLRSIIASLDTSNVFVSYSDDGQIGPEKLKSILSEFGSVSIGEHEYNRYRSNGGAKAGRIYEKLYHLHMEQR